MKKEPFDRTTGGVPFKSGTTDILLCCFIAGGDEGCHELIHGITEAGGC